MDVQQPSLVQVTFIPGNEINSELGIVNAARVSLARKSQWLKEQPTLSEADAKLIQYLAKHNHWTPFAHSRLYFEIQWVIPGQALEFFENYNPAGFSHVTETIDNTPTSLCKGSLYGWIHALPYLSLPTRQYITKVIAETYPITAEAFHLSLDPFVYGSRTLAIPEKILEYTERWKLLTATLLVKVPIFVARQIRTSQVGFAYSDLYVEGESFVYNEVSRRYVNSDPEFYTIEEWRVREGTGVKQGSTGVASKSLQEMLKLDQEHVLQEASHFYECADEYSIAPEQARALLPQSMYTEFYMTGTLHRWAQFLHLRLQPDVQEETRVIAQYIHNALAREYPAWASAYYLWRNPT